MERLYQLRSLLRQWAAGYVEGRGMLNRRAWMGLRLELGLRFALGFVLGVERRLNVLLWQHLRLELRLLNGAITRIFLWSDSGDMVFWVGKRVVLIWLRRLRARKRVMTAVESLVLEPLLLVLFGLVAVDEDAAHDDFQPAEEHYDVRVEPGRKAIAMVQGKRKS